MTRLYWVVVLLIQKKKKITPKPPNVRTQNKNYSIFTRIQCLTLYEYDVKARIVEKYCEIENRRPNDQTVARWLRKTIKQNYDKTMSRIILLKHVQNKSRSERSKITISTLKTEIIAENKYVNFRFISNFLTNCNTKEQKRSKNDCRMSEIQTRDLW